jgi:hypothetical protein
MYMPQKRSQFSYSDVGLSAVPMAADCASSAGSNTRTGTQPDDRIGAGAVALWIFPVSQREQEDARLGEEQGRTVVPD